MKRKIIITGGAGFIGANLAIALKRNFEDCEVVSFDNLYRNGSELNLPRLRKNGVKFIRGDVRNSQDLSSLGKIDFLIECSAEPSVLAGKDGGTDYLVGTNLYGAINCAELCRKHDAPMIFLSTSRVYPIAPLQNCEIRKSEKRFDFAKKQKIRGLCEKGVSENFPMDGARSLYGATKYAAETILQDYSEAFGFPIVTTRFGVIAGAWQFGKSDQGIVPFWLASHYLGKPLKYIGFGGKGKQVRDFLHIDDLINLSLMQIKKPAKFAKAGVFNAGGGFPNSASLIELTKLCQDITGGKLEIGFDTQTRYADIPIYISDNSKITSFCGWKPEKNLAAILCSVYEWIKNCPQTEKIF
jgi:CDP-paratose 2-epimerase